MITSCQKEELTVVETNIDSSFVQDPELSRLMQSVTAHNGSFDDVIDQSDCFSINFPYEVFFNGEPYNIASVADLVPIDELDEIQLMYPLTITLGNHAEMTLLNETEFINLKNECAAGTLYNDLIDCVDFVYPIRVALFEPATSNYQTITLDSDEETFESIDDFTSETLVSINYPFDIRSEEGIFIAINSNIELKSQIATAEANCN